MLRTFLLFVIFAGFKWSVVFAQAVPYCPLGGQCRSVPLNCVGNLDFVAGPLPSLSIVPFPPTADTAVTASVRFDGTDYEDPSLAPIVEAARSEVRIYQLLRHNPSLELPQSTCQYDIGFLSPGQYHIELWSGDFVGPIRKLASADFAVGSVMEVPTVGSVSLALLVFAVLLMAIPSLPNRALERTRRQVTSTWRSLSRRAPVTLYR